MSILIVDDEAEIRDSLSEILKMAGYEVITASGGQEALQALGQQDVKMMLVDLSMPGMSGEELLAALDKKDRKPPALVITAMAPWQMMELVKSGIGYMRKPINSAMLLSAVANIVGRE